MSIFDQSDSPSESTQELHKKEKAKALAAEELTNLFHDNHIDSDDNEPDWTSLLRNSKNQREKLEVMRTRDVWKAAQRERVFNEQQAAFDKKIDGILSTPQHLRNKQFYDNLAATDPGASYNVRVQKQRQRDRQQMGLAFHLKAR